MNDRALEEAMWLLYRARGTAVVLRVLMVIGPVAALVCARLAAGYSSPIVGVAVVALALVCVVTPDSHIGLLVVLLVATGWLTTVDEHATPWSIGVAAALTIFHASVAAATIAPPAARWTRAMCLRWLRRSVVVVIASAGSWLVVAAIDNYRVTSNDLLVAAALATLAAGWMWATKGKSA